MLWVKTQLGLWTANKNSIKVNLYTQKEIMWEIWRSEEVIGLGMASNEKEGKQLAEEMVKLFITQNKEETPQDKIKRGSLPPGLRIRK